MSAALNAQDRAALRQFMADHFNMAELTEICFDLSLDIEEFPRATKSELVQSLIEYHERKGNLACLLVEILKRREDEAIGRLLAQVGGCQARKKAQLILAQDVVVKPEIKAALAQLLGVSQDEVAIMAAAPGSTRLLVGLPGPAADRLLALAVQTLANGRYEVLSVRPYEALPPIEQLDWRRRVLDSGSGGTTGRGGGTTGRGGGAAGAAGRGSGWPGWLTLLALGLLVGGGLVWVVTTRPGAPAPPTPGPTTVVIPPTRPGPAATPTPTAPPRRPTPTPTRPPTRTLTPTQTATNVPLTVRASAAPDPVCYGECGNRPTRVTVRAEVQGADSPRGVQSVTLEYRYRSTNPRLAAGAWRKAPMQRAAGSLSFTVVVDVGREAYPDLRGTQGVFEFQVVAVEASGDVAQSKTDTVSVDYLIG